MSPTNSCPHTTASPDGVCDECRGTVAATVPHAPFGPGGPAGHCAKHVAAEPAAPQLPTSTSIHTGKPVFPLAYPLRADRHVVIDQRGRWIFGWLHFATSEQEAERLVADMNEAERRRAKAVEPAAPCPHVFLFSDGTCRACGVYRGHRKPLTVHCGNPTTDQIGPSVATEPQPQKPKAITRYRVDPCLAHDSVRTYASYTARDDPAGEWMRADDVLAHIAALTHRDADVGREAVALIIRDGWDECDSDRPTLKHATTIANCILSKFHVAKKG